MDTVYQAPPGILKAVKFSILSQDDARGLSSKSLELPNEVTDPALGLPNPSNLCLTCGASDRKTCEGHFGLVNFPATVINPFFITEVAKILNKICPGCKTIRRMSKKSSSRPIKSCRYCDTSSRDRYPTMKFRVSCKELFGKTAIIAEVSEKISKAKNFGQILAGDYWSFIDQDPNLADFKNDFLKPNMRIITPAQAYNILKEVDQSLLEGICKKKKSIFLNCLLVTPNCHRVTEFGQHMIFDESTKHYRRLINFGGSANELNNRVLDRLKCSKLRADKAEAQNPNAPASGSKYVKELILAKRTDHIFRMVVVGDPYIKLSEIGIPCHIAERLKISEHLNTWNWDQLKTYCEIMILGKGEITIRRNGDLVCLKSVDDLKQGDVVYRPLIDGDVVLICRPPSIHQHSLIALSVKILPYTAVLSINPLICSPFRGDFDGDCLHGYVPQSVNSKVELRELVGLDKQLIDGQNGKNLLSLSQDSLTGASLMLEDGVVLNKFESQQLQMFCSRKLDLNSITSGKELFSLFLPENFNYDFPEHNVKIRDGQIVSSSFGSSWLRDFFSVLAKFYKDEALECLNAAQEALCEWLSMRGLSVSLSDLYLTSDFETRENLLDEVSCGLNEALLHSRITLAMIHENQDFLSGEFKSAPDFEVENLAIEQQKSAALNKVSIASFKDVFRDVQTLLYPYTENDNSLLAMFKAGSKGNLLKLVQQSMCLGLQNSLVPLSFHLPHELTCDSWNDLKTRDVPEHSRTSYIPFGVVENSFLEGLNPLECFVHSVIVRDGSFSGHADVAGVLTRRLMYFMRDLCVSYDGTVRNSYGNRVVQFSYGEGNEKDASGAHPVGALAACAISEAAYSALDLPVSPLQSSPLLNFKSVLECGVRKRSGPKSATLYLSKKLDKRIYGSEYGALDVKNHLEGVPFSEITSSVMIFYSPDTTNRTRTSSWVCHFHIDKEVAKNRSLSLRSIIDALRSKYNSFRIKSKKRLPEVKIINKVCSEENDKYCITVVITETTLKSSRQLDVLKKTVIPFFLGTAVKGFQEFKKVDILWKDEPKSSKGFLIRAPGELYIRVYMSEKCDRTKFWKVLMVSCLRIWDLIDWERSHPDDIHDMAEAFGIDVAQKHFLTNLRSAVSEAGKNILPEHLGLVADCLASTGEFVALSASGFALQRKETSIASPFAQAFLANPADSFIKAAKMGVTDNLSGSIDALAWGNTPSIGTGGHFDIIYSGQVNEPAKPTDVYSILSCNAGSSKENIEVTLPEKDDEISGKSLTQSLFSKTTISKATLRNYLSVNDIINLSRKLKSILHKYELDEQLSEVDKSIAMMALCFHPRRKEKIGCGADEIKVSSHTNYGESRCFLVVRTDGTEEDFSYHKCIHRALELIAPNKAKPYHSRWLNGRN